MNITPLRHGDELLAHAPRSSLIGIPQPSSLQFPVPLTGTEPLVPGAATLTLIVALFAPVDDGLNVTLIWHVACAAIVPEQVVLCITNWFELVPPLLMLLIVKFASGLVLVRVMVWGELTVPCLTVPNANDAGDSV